MNQLNIYNENLTELSNTQSFSNRAFLYGESLFTTIRISNFKPLFLNEHIERMNKSLDFLYGTRCDDNVRKNILKLCEKFKEGKLRVTFYQESDYEGLIDKKGLIHTLYFIKEIESDFLEDVATIKLCFAETRKVKSLLPSFLKNGNYILQSLEKEKAVKNNFHDVLFLSQEGFVTESSTSNILFRKGDCFIAPEHSSMVLDGITMKVLAQGMTEKAYNLSYESLSKDDLGSVDQAWLLSSVIGLQNISQIEKNKFEAESNWTSTLKSILKEQTKNE
jgi:branched-subunit amino acid aminotransferase/4-amino-4-deoxychorismate lyase